MNRKPKPFRLSVRAINDLQNVFKYTLEKWGVEQAKKYTLFIELSFERIGVNNRFVRELKVSSEKQKYKYYSYHVKKHRIVFRETEHHYLVLRILHQSMDAKRHL